MYKLVEVRWKDITHLSRAKDIEMVMEMELMEFSSVGYLIYGDENRICVACSILHQESTIYVSEDDFREILIIPKSNIVKIKYLKVVKNKK